MRLEGRPIAVGFFHDVGQLELKAHGPERREFQFGIARRVEFQRHFMRSHVRRHLILRVQLQRSFRVADGMAFHVDDVQAQRGAREFGDEFGDCSAHIGVFVGQPLFERNARGFALLFQRLSGMLARVEVVRAQLFNERVGALDGLLGAQFQAANSQCERGDDNERKAGFHAEPI